LCHILILDDGDIILSKYGNILLAGESIRVYEISCEIAKYIFFSNKNITYKDF
jgi:hypothetical protein